MHVSCDLPDRVLQWEVKPHLSSTTFLPGIGEISDAKMGTSLLLDVVHLRLLLLEGPFEACGTLHDGVYASEVGMVLPRQIEKEVVGLRTQIISCPIPELFFKGSIMLLIWGEGLPAKKKK